MTKATGVAAALLLGACICSTIASDDVNSNLSTEDQVRIETLSLEFDRLRTTGIVTEDLARMLQVEACKAEPTPGAASLMRAAAPYWQESTVGRSLTTRYAECLLDQVYGRTKIAVAALEILPQLPGEPGREVAISLLSDETAPVPLRAKAATTFYLRTTPLPQDLLLDQVEGSADERLYSAAAYALRRSNDPDIVFPLVRSVNRFWNPAVRLTLRARIDLVYQAAESSNPDVREAALRALRHLSTDEPTPGSAGEAE